VGSRSQKKTARKLSAQPGIEGMGRSKSMGSKKPIEQPKLAPTRFSLIASQSLGLQDESDLLEMQRQANAAKATPLARQSSRPANAKESLSSHIAEGQGQQYASRASQSSGAPSGTCSPSFKSSSGSSDEEDSNDDDGTIGRNPAVAELSAVEKGRRASNARRSAELGPIPMKGPNGKEYWSLEDLFDYEGGKPSIVDGNCSLCERDLDGRWGSARCRGCSIVDAVDFAHHPFRDLLLGGPPAGVKLIPPEAQIPDHVERNDLTSPPIGRLEGHLQKLCNHNNGQGFLQTR